MKLSISLTITMLSVFCEYLFFVTGKSSLANALLGCDPASNDCMFGVCGGMDSCTKNTTLGKGQWRGSGNDFTVSTKNVFF